MGFWNWVTTRLAGEPTSAPVQSLPSSGEIFADGCGSTAVLDAPLPAGNEGPQWWSPLDGLQALAEPQRPDLSAEARALENLLILHFDGRNLSLPSLPQVPERVLRMLADSRCGLKEVAAEIGKDPVTAASVIRMSNSALYAGVAKITSIEGAVVRLGGNVVRTLMYNLSLRSVMFSEQRKGTHFAEDLWHRALASGLIMRSLSRFTNMNPEEAFLTGLLHDVGNIVVLRIVNSQREMLKTGIDEDTFEYLCHEAHQEFGELLADSWALPSRLKSLICDHHADAAADDTCRTERLQLQLADTICALLNYSPYQPVNLLESRAAVELKLTDRPELAEFLHELPVELEAALMELGS